MKTTGKTILTLFAGILLGAALFSGGVAHAAELFYKAIPSTNTVYLDGQRVELEAFAIEGSNYVKLRDVGELMNFNVYWNGAVQIDSDAPYTGITPSTSAPAQPTVSKDTEGSCLTNGKPITEENVLELLRQIEQDWPTDTIWGTHNTPGTHKNEVPSTESGRIMRSYHVSNTYGCGAYASMVSSLIFGDTANPGRKLDDLSKIRPGDIIFQIRNDSGKIVHVTLALESPSSINAFHITDGNVGGTIQWPDKGNPYGRDNLDSYRGENTTYRLEVWTRYPENVPYTGSSVMGWPTGT